MKKTLVALFALTLSVPFFLAGCGASIEDACQHQCDCEQSCKADDVSKCVDEGNQLADAADKAGCGSEFDDYVACVNSAQCNGHGLDVDSRCKSQEKALEKCGGKLESGVDD